MIKTINLNPAPVVAAGQTAVFDLNNMVGMNLESINLTLGGTTFTKAQVTGIRLKGNAKLLFETDGTKLDLLEQFKGYTADTNTLFINFMEVKARSEFSFQAGAWLLDANSGIVNLRLEVDIAAGAVAPTLIGYAEVSPPVVFPNETGSAYLLHRRTRAIIPITAAGKYALQIPHLDPAGGGSMFKRVAMFCSNMTALQVVTSGTSVFDGTVAQLAALQKKAARVPQTGMVVWDNILDNLTGKQLLVTKPGIVTSAQFYGTFSAGETVTVETEELLPLAAY